MERQAGRLMSGHEGMAAASKEVLQSLRSDGQSMLESRGVAGEVCIVGSRAGGDEIMGLGHCVYILLQIELRRARESCRP